MVVKIIKRIVAFFTTATKGDNETTTELNHKEVVKRLQTLKEKSKERRRHG